MREKDKSITVREIARNLFMIRLASRLPAIKFPVNLYFFAGEDGLLWDAGYGGELPRERIRRALDTIRQKMAERGEKCKVSKILISHAHIDHFSGLAGLRKITGAKILLTANQARKIENKAAFRNAWRGKRTDIRGSLPFFHFYLNLIHFRLEEWLYGMSWMPDPDEIIPESGMLRAGSRILRYFPIPGHADDHLALYDASEGLLFSGDHLLHRTTWLGPPLSNIDSYEKSIEHLLALTSLQKILPAHGPPLENPLLQLEKTLQYSRSRTDKLCRTLAGAGEKGLSFYELILSLYPAASIVHRLSAQGWILLTLQMLVERGRVGIRPQRGQKTFFLKDKP